MDKTKYDNIIINCKDGIRVPYENVEISFTGNYIIIDDNKWIDFIEIKDIEIILTKPTKEQLEKAYNCDN